MRVPKKAKVPIRIVGMPQPAPHEHETTIDPVTSNIACLGDCFVEFRFRWRRQNLVGIENENPFVAKRQVLERPILFLWPGAVEFELHHFGAEVLGDRDRAIRALGIDHENFVRPFHTVETARQIHRFIFNWNDDGNRNARVHRGRKTRHGFPAAKTSDGTSSVTTEHAPMTLRSPMVTPGKTNARAPIKASAPIVIFAAVRGILGWEKSWLAVLRYTSWAMVARSPISISPSEYALARSP